MIIKSKYNNFIRPYMRTVRQGFGSAYGGNHSAVVNNNNQENSSVNINESELFLDSGDTSIVNNNNVAGQSVNARGSASDSSSNSVINNNNEETTTVNINEDESLWGGNVI
tara:strand:+ start:243 stop:575 length:333 start_codon:yes stop_codon:yes gene_type:complete